MLRTFSVSARSISVRFFCRQSAKWFSSRRHVVLKWEKPLLLNQKIKNLEIYQKATYATNSQIEEYTYEKIKDLPNHPEIVLIDVREPLELKKTGQIPQSINIPLGSVDADLSDDITAEAFEKKYCRQKPHKDSIIVFYCQLGKRSTIAAEAAVKLGYTNVKNYKGSWVDWAEHEGLPTGMPK